MHAYRHLKVMYSVDVLLLTPPFQVLYLDMASAFFGLVLAVVVILCFPARVAGVGGVKPVADVRESEDVGVILYTSVNFVGLATLVVTPPFLRSL
jgi:hypothetical protein